MQKKINFAIVGCGRISDLHAPGYLQNPNADVYAVCDVDKERAQEKAEKWNVKPERVFTEYAELLKLKEIDAVELLLPHHLHKDLTIQAAEAGKHVSVQKPMAMTLSECEEMIRAARKNGVKLRVFENFRFYPPYMKAKEILESGAIGNPSFIHIKLGTSRMGGWEVPMDAWMWRFNPDTCGGGPLCWDDGYHKFSIAEYFLGMVEKVKAWIDSTGIFEDEDEPPFRTDAPSTIMWKYKKPRRYGSMEVTYSRDANIPSKYYTADERVEITGEKGYIWVNQCTAESVRNEAPLLTFIEGKVTEYNDLETDWLSSFIEAVNHFVWAILNDDEPNLTGELGMYIQQFAQAAQESARQGKEILVDDIR
ncbi:MAG: Gfo/Idh/MocA family protein [Candidatus Thorarchaeota archaeon]